MSKLSIDTDTIFSRLRAGVASGMVVSRAGDWFGSPVNMTSRVTGAARPGSVLVAEPRHSTGHTSVYVGSWASRVR